MEEFHSWFRCYIILFCFLKLFLFLAIRNVTGHYYLNGNWRIDFPRSLKFAGTIFHYERKPHGFYAPESLSALGPTSEPIYIVVSVNWNFCCEKWFWFWAQGFILTKYKIVELVELFWCYVQPETWKAEDIPIIVKSWIKTELLK